MAHTVFTELGFATAEDGARLDWQIYKPDPVAFPGPRPALILYTSSGFDQVLPSPDKEKWAGDSAEKGIIVYEPTVRLAATKPSHPNWIPRQTVDGVYPTQINDAKRAILAVYADTTRCQGIGHVMVGGGSGGASLACYCLLDTTTQVSPVAWDTSKRPLAGIFMSGAYDFSDRNPSTDPDLPYAISVFERFTQTATTHDLVVMKNKSPVHFITAGARPMWIIDGTDAGDTMPQDQRPAMGLALDAAGVTNYRSTKTLNGHAYSNYAVVTQDVQDYMAAIFAGGVLPPPPPPNTGLPTGVSALMGAGITVDVGVYSSPSVDAISLRKEWSLVNPDPITFDFSYFQNQMTTILAARPSMVFNLLVQTGGGSRHFGDFKPDWLFNLLADNPKQSFGGVSTLGSPNITGLLSGQFVSGDIGKQILAQYTLNGALFTPFQNLTPVYIGAVVSATVIAVSSSASSNVPVNANATATGLFVQAWTPGGVAYDSHHIKPGVTYSFSLDGGSTNVTIPVFWDATLAARKRALYQAMMDWFATLSPDMQNAVRSVRVAWANGNGDDWNIPDDNTLSEGTGYTESQLDRWLNLPTGSPPNGAGYKSKLMTDTAITTVPFNDIFTNAQVSGGNLIKCKAAGFGPADVGRPIAGTGTGIDNTNTIRKIHPATDINGPIAEVFPGATNGALASFTILGRKTGLFDTARVAFPNLPIGHSIAQNGRLLDKPAADVAGDTDVMNFLARTTNTALQAAYSPNILTQKNGVSATTIVSDKATSKSGYGVLKEIGLVGNPIAGQALGRVAGDTTFRMNNGSRTDHDCPVPGTCPDLTDDQILERSGSHLATYKGLTFYEIYAADVTGLPIGTKFIHDLLHTGGGGGIEPPPPPPPPPPPAARDVLEPFLTIEDVNFQDDVIFKICDLLKLSVKDGLASLSRERLAIFERGINTHVRYAWRLWRWMEFDVLEERAFAPVWNADDDFPMGSRVYYIGALDSVTGLLAGGGYFYATSDSLAGTLPSDVDFWAPFTLKTSEYVIPLLQPCRRRIGDVIGVFPNDPRQFPVNTAWFSLGNRVSNRGLEVYGYGAQSTVFILYRAVPYLYNATPYDPAASYAKSELVLDTTGLVYRAIVDVSSGLPLSDPRFGFVPFPAALANYVVYMTAADNSDDANVANQWRSLALEFLTREMDIKGEEMPVSRWGHGQSGYFIPPGTSSFLWSVVPPYTAPDGSSTAQTTIAERCLSEFGDVIPTS